MDLSPDLIDLLTEFENSEVRYLVVGGWAVGIHGEPRYTKDLDLLIGKDPENLTRTVVALERYGAPASLVEEVRTMKDNEFVFFGVPPARVDILREVPGVDFEEAWQLRLSFDWRGRRLQVLGFDHLLASKRAAGRSKDLEDVRRLEALAGTRK